MRSQFVEEVREIPEHQLIFLDESGISRYLYREYGRSPRGQLVLGEISGNRYGRQSVISGLSGGKLIGPMCFDGTCNTELFNTWLEKVLLPELSPGQVLILDNASFHKSCKSKELVKKAGCQLMFLPAYSPDLNPIEKYWAIMKARVREKLPESSSLAQALDEVILSM